MLNFNKNKLINKVLDKYYETFSLTLDTAEFVPDKYNDKISKYIFKNMKKSFKKIDKEDKVFQRELKRQERKKQRIESKKKRKLFWRKIFKRADSNSKGQGG